jgi:predicted ATP-grasp superfamily ATP-dependent carboligase
VTRLLLTDGDQRSTLAAVRALGRAGYEVFVAESSAGSLASRSRQCRGTVVYPSPYDDESGFVEALSGAAGRLGIHLVLPMTDITSAVLAEHRDAFTSARVAVPDSETFWRASDKNALHVLADRLGVPTPTTHYIGRGEEFPGVGEFPVPCVIKPARSRVRTETGWVKTAVLRAESRDEAASLLRSRAELRYGCMIQRVVEGDGVGLFALCDRGEPRLLFAHRRLREKPPWGGVSVLREAVPIDPVAADHATRLLRALSWHGVAMVEFKRDRVTGVPILMEVNARFWGSLQLAIDAGVDFPVQAVKLWLGESVAAQTAYRVGVRSRWLLGDLDHLLLRMFGNGPAPPDAPGLPALMFDFCRFLRRDTHYEVESLSDPGPSLYEIRTYASNLFRTLGRASH